MIRVKVRNPNSERLSGTVRVTYHYSKGHHHATVIASKVVKLRSSRRGTLHLQISSRAVKRLQKRVRRYYPIKVTVRVHAADGRKAKTTGVYLLYGKRSYRNGKIVVPGPGHSVARAAC
jgi:hypothetical protein